MDGYFGAVLNSKRPLGPEQNSRRVIAGSFVNSLITQGHLCIWELTCSCVVPPGVGPRVRMKQRVRAVGVRSELTRVLPPSQRGILVADAVASLWIAGGMSCGVRQLKPMSSKLAGALRVFGGPALRQTCSCCWTLLWSWGAQNVPACSAHLHFLLAVHTHDCHGKAGRFSFCEIVDASRAVLGLRVAWWRPSVQLPSTGVHRASFRRGVQRSISPRLKVIAVCPLKLESSSMP